MITVCSACLQASCWQGIFYCDEYKTAGTVEKTVEELRALNLEHPSYWEPNSTEDFWNNNQGTDLAGRLFNVKKG